MSTRVISNSKKKNTAGIAYSEAEERAVTQINGIAKGVYDVNRKIGELVNALVDEGGGVKHGDRTLDRLAMHPMLMCSREQLRRCWQYYRLTAQYDKDVQKIAPSLSYSHMYQLSRLLDIEDEKDQRDAVLAMAKQAAEKHMTATKLANSVSTHLKSIGKAARGKSARESTETSTKEDDQSTEDLYEAFLGTTATVVKATERIIASDTVGHIAEMRSATNRLGFAYVRLVERLVRGDDDALSDARKVADALAETIKKVDDNGGSANGNV